MINLNELSLSRLTPGATINLIAGLLGEARAAFERNAKLAPWIGDLEVDLNALLNAPGAPVPTQPGDEAQPQPSPPDGAALDRRAEATVQATRFMLMLAERLAFARGEDTEALRWTQTTDFIFPEGLGFLGGSYHEQTGATERMLALARNPQIASITGSLSFSGTSFNDVLDLTQVNSAALADYDKLRHAAKTEAEAADGEDLNPSIHPTLALAQRKTNSTLRQIFGIIAREFPDQSTDDAKTLLSPIRRAFNL